MTRADGRAFDQLRPVELTKDYVKFAEGSDDVKPFDAREYEAAISG